MGIIDLENLSAVFRNFHNNIDILEDNLNRVLWGLNEIKYLLDYHPELIKEFEKIYDEEEGDIESKIDEAISITINQYYVLLYSYLDEYRLKLQEKIKFTKLKKNNGVKTVFDFLFLERKMDFNNYNEIRNAIVHKNRKVSKGYIIKLKDYIGSDKKVHLSKEKFKVLFDDIYNFCIQIDRKIVNEFPEIID